VSADFPGELEQMVLLAVLRHEEAFASSIIQELEETAGRSASRGSIYRTLDRMEEKGWIRHEMEESTPDRGGHRRRRYEVTAEGVATLRTSREALRNLWDGLESVLGDGAP
jgi:DNA-binding PadR family transcriptional regulator